MPPSVIEHSNEKIGIIPAAIGKDRLGRRTEDVARIT